MLRGQQKGALYIHSREKGHKGNKRDKDMVWLYKEMERDTRFFY